MNSNDSSLKIELTFSKPCFSSVSNLKFDDTTNVLFYPESNRSREPLGNYKNIFLTNSIEVISIDNSLVIFEEIKFEGVVPGK